MNSYACWRHACTKHCQAKTQCCLCCVWLDAAPADTALFMWQTTTHHEAAGQVNSKYCWVAGAAAAACCCHCATHPPLEQQEQHKCHGGNHSHKNDGIQQGATELLPCCVRVLQAKPRRTSDNQQNRGQQCVNLRWRRAWVSSIAMHTKTPLQVMVCS